MENLIEKGEEGEVEVAPLAMPLSTALIWVLLVEEGKPSAMWIVSPLTTVQEGVEERPPEPEQEMSWKEEGSVIYEGNLTSMTDPAGIGETGEMKLSS